MSYRVVGATESPPVGPEEKLDRILENQAAEAKRRRTTITIGILGAIIAAGRLGIVAVPMIHAARARKR